MHTNFPASLVFKTLPSSAVGGEGKRGLIPGRRTKIPHAVRYSQKVRKKKTYAYQFCSFVYTPGRFSHNVLEDISIRISSVLLWDIKTLKSQCWNNTSLFFVLIVCSSHIDRGLFIHLVSLRPILRKPSYFEYCAFLYQREKVHLGGSWMGN